MSDRFTIKLINSDYTTNRVLVVEGHDTGAIQHAKNLLRSPFRDYAFVQVIDSEGHLLWKGEED